MTDSHRDEWAAAAEGDPDARGIEGDDAPPLPNLFHRVTMVVFSPGDLFPRLAARPAWFGATVVAAVLSALLAFVPSAMPGLAEATSDQGIELEMVKVMRMAMPAVLLAVTLVSVLVVSGLTYVAFVFVRGDEATFKQHLSVISHSWILNGLASAAILAMFAAGLSPSLDTVTVGALLPFLPDGFLSSFLDQVSLFGLWSAVIAGLGLSLLDPRRRWGPTAAVTVGMTLALALVGAAIASVRN